MLQNVFWRKTFLKPGNSAHFKNILHRTDVNGKVKGTFDACWRMHGPRTVS